MILSPSLELFECVAALWEWAAWVSEHQQGKPAAGQPDTRGALPMLLVAAAHWGLCLHVATKGLLSLVADGVEAGCRTSHQAGGNGAVPLLTLNRNRGVDPVPLACVSGWSSSTGGRSSSGGACSRHISLSLSLCLLLLYGSSSLKPTPWTWFLLCFSSSSWDWKAIGNCYSS